MKESEKQLVTVKMSDGLLAKLDEMSRYSKMSRSAVIRSCVNMVYQLYNQDVDNMAHDDVISFYDMMSTM